MIQTWRVRCIRSTLLVVENHYVANKFFAGDHGCGMGSDAMVPIFAPTMIGDQRSLALITCSCSGWRFNWTYRPPWDNASDRPGLTTTGDRDNTLQPCLNKISERLSLIEMSPALLLGTLHMYLLLVRLFRMMCSSVKGGTTRVIRHNQVPSLGISSSG